MKYSNEKNKMSSSSFYVENQDNTSTKAKIFSVRNIIIASVTLVLLVGGVLIYAYSFLSNDTANEVQLSDSSSAESKAPVNVGEKKRKKVQMKWI